MQIEKEKCRHILSGLLRAEILRGVSSHGRLSAFWPEKRVSPKENLGSVVLLLADSAQLCTWPDGSIVTGARTCKSPADCRGEFERNINLPIVASAKHPLLISSTERVSSSLLERNFRALEGFHDRKMVSSIS
jgi:hypothetical protein